MTDARDLTPRQFYWLNRIAGGDGATSANNATLRSLARAGLARVTWRPNPSAKLGKIAFWVMTEVGSRRLSAIRQQAGVI